MSKFFKSTQREIANNNMRKLVILENCYFRAVRLEYSTKMVTYNYIAGSFNTFSVSSENTVNGNIKTSKCKIVTKTVYRSEREIFIITDIGRFKIPRKAVDMLIDVTRGQKFEQFLDLTFPSTMYFDDDTQHTTDVLLKVYYGENYV